MVHVLLMDTLIFPAYEISFFRGSMYTAITMFVRQAVLDSFFGVWEQIKQSLFNKYGALILEVWFCVVCSSGLCHRQG